jgi:hypothetical protein
MLEVVELAACLAGGLVEGGLRGFSTNVRSPA